MCCTVLEVKEDGLLLDIWDYQTDENIICISKDMSVVIESGWDVSYSVPVFDSDKLAVSYGYEAVKLLHLMSVIR